MKILCLVALILSLAALSCESAEPAPLAGTSWTLLAMGDGDTLRTVDLDLPVVLEFLDGGAELTGSTGCNGYGGEYEIAGASFRTVDVLITERGCPTRALFDREHEYKNSLADATHATVTHGGSLLVVEAEGGRVLVFGSSEVDAGATEIGTGSRSAEDENDTSDSKVGLQTRDSDGNTPLHIAVRDDNMAEVQALLDSGADVNARNDYGTTPLHSVRSNAALVQLLLANGADINASTAHNDTPLSSAAGGDLAIVQILLDAGANPNGVEFDNIPLRYAVGSRNLPVIQALLDAGADPDATDPNGRESALYEAVRMEYLPGVQMLLDNGADPNIEVDEVPILLTALDGGDPAVIQALLDAGGNPNAKHEDGETALHIAAEWFDHFPEVLPALLDAGASKEVRNRDGKTPLEIAEERGHATAVELLK